MKEFLDGNKEETQTPDTPTPINSAGVPTQGHSNAAGDFDVVKELRRKVKSRKDLSQPAMKVKNRLEDVSQPQYQEGPLATAGSQQDNATDRYFGSFSIESKRNVWDLLDKHPKFDQQGNVRMNRIGNNTRKILLNDPTKTVNNGGNISYQNQPQASQEEYD
jgi:hypothetical protein